MWRLLREPPPDARLHKTMAAAQPLLCGPLLRPDCCPGPPEPDGGDAAAAQLPLPIGNERILQLVIQVSREEGLGRRAQQRVLARNVPPVPAEAVHAGAQRVAQPAGRG